MLYSLLKNYIRIVLFFYYKKIKVIGKEYIPKEGAVLFICNHPNALLDPLLVVTNNVRDIYFLTRASAFKNHLVAKFLMHIKMIPIYRKRDNVNVIEKNKNTFSKSVELMKAKNTLFIAAEGSHNIQRRVRELKKGFTHIILDTFKKYPENNIQVVPVGLNYDNVMNYPSSVAIYYGKPINAKDFYYKNDTTYTTNELLKVVSASLKSLTTHIEDIDSYEKTIQKLNALNVDYLDPIKTNKSIKTISNYDIKYKKMSIKKQQKILYYIIIINSIFPWMIWRRLKENINEKEFISTFRFVIGATLFPVFYTIQGIIINYFFENTIALLYLFCSICLTLLYTKTQ